MRKKIRVDMEMHSHVNDPVIIDTLVLKGFNDLEEVRISSVNEFIAHRS
jgi:hypothetical protein